MNAYLILIFNMKSSFLFLFLPFDFPIFYHFLYFTEKCFIQNPWNSFKELMRDSLFTEKQSMRMIYVHILEKHLSVDKGQSKMVLVIEIQPGMIWKS